MARLGVVFGVLLACLVAVSSASAASPWWNVSSSARPGHLQPGGEGIVTVRALNIGDQASAGNVTVSAALPAGLVVQSVGLYATSVVGGKFDLSVLGLCETTPTHVQCSYPKEFGFPGVRPFGVIELQIAVKVQPGAASGVESVHVEGGGAPSASFEAPLTVAGSPTPFGVDDFRFIPEEDGGAIDTRAGSHPFQLTATLGVNQNADITSPPALVRDFSFDLPPGLVGNATAVAQCSERAFSQVINGAHNLCPADTVVGVAAVNLARGTEGGGELESHAVPLFNLTPGPGEPARFGFEVVNTPVIIDTSVRSGRDYGVVASTRNISQIEGFISTQLVLWGVPDDPRHDISRGVGCLEESEPCAPPAEHNPIPLLTLPTACEGPLTTAVEGLSWPTQGSPGGVAFPRVEYTLRDPLGEPLSMTGCNQLPFTPSISVTPESHSASTPTGLDVHVHLPQDTTGTASGLGEAAIRDATVALPEGMSLDPSGAGGLAACSESQVGFQGTGGDGTWLFTPEIDDPFCPDASKVGTVRVRLPIIPNALEGAVYVASQDANPFGSLVALYIVVEDPASGILVKLPGEVSLDPGTGRVLTTFADTPQAPVEDLELHFFGGNRGPLVTPAACGTYTTSASFTPWSGTAVVDASSVFAITSGAGGGACPSPAPFAPSLVAGTTSPQAGGFSPFTATFSRGDGEQALAGVSVTTPPGLLGILKGVERCGEPQASKGTCGAGSLIGHTTVAAGAGPEPFAVQGGQVFLTGPYKGAPFGLSIVVPAVAGPFDLGDVVVRAAVHVDPHTAQITVTSDPLPTILQGIPLLVKQVNVSIDRPGFTFNPTNCQALSVNGSLTSTQGATAGASSHFQAVNCASLPFKPTFKVATQAKTGKKQGASLDVKVGSGLGQANLAKVAVTLPRQLPARLTTIQQACLAAVFNANPANCPVGSNIGTAMATTPVFAGSLAGPVYLVSHGGAAFPDVVVILQGEGVTLDLTGSIDIKHDITSSTFASIPDAPISSFELKLPEGPHSGLAAVVPAKAKGNLCGTALTMPTTMTGQNGAVLKQTTKIAVTGCGKAKPNTRRAHGKKAKVKHSKGKSKQKRG